MVEKNVLDLICCPNCQGDLKKGVDEKRGVGFRCDSCSSFFKYKDGVIVLISKELEKELRS